MCFVFLQTERFTIRQWKLDDATALWKIMSDSRVHQYTGDTPWTKERTVEYIQFMLDQNFCTLELFHGACILRDSQTLIGLIGLNPYLPKQPEIEWQFGVPFWSKGYATEIGRAVVANAFSFTDIEAIYGMANPRNLGAIRVMEKIGMTCWGLQDFHGEQDLFHKIDRSSVLG
ncbi:MAG: GNAT family N-acetyltransferase [Anaerolineales bacterium]|jgi:RimJ/RimL family protein N-acetyltransferase|nr:GNAT family N-acetyltransferase [Anaerolineales bacterium]